MLLKKRKRLLVVDQDREYPNIILEVPEDRGIKDKKLIKISLDQIYITKIK